MPTVQTGDVETYYEQRGDGPPVVLVHGAVLDHAQWDEQVAALSEAYTTVAYDVRGHGRTGGSARRSYWFDLFAEDLRALIAGLDLERPVVVGHSMGGCIAQTYAARWPDELAGLVLADTFTPELLTRGEWLQRSVLLRAVVPPVRLLGYRRVEKALVWLHERIHGEDVSGDYDRVERLHEESPSMSTDEFVKVIRALARFHETDLDFAAIDVPTLVLYGEHEAGFLVRQAVKLAGELPDARVRVVPDAGHASNLDNPEAYTRALLAFLSKTLEVGAANGSSGAATFDRRWREYE